MQLYSLCWLCTQTHARLNVQASHHCSLSAGCSCPLEQHEQCILACQMLRLCGLCPLQQGEAKIVPSKNAKTQVRPVCTAEAVCLCLQALPDSLASAQRCALPKPPSQWQWAAQVSGLSTKGAWLILCD